ncbi:MAG: acylphosphatase [candidate division Zixibacteria bacterium]|jgi:acylphosphatase|nr:acylphosphatase [candidate division Zixibacteria bacterium]
MKQTAAAELHITGLVQGVGYRYFCSREASRLGITGWVKNLSDGSVRVMAEGERQDIETLIERLRVGPFGAHVDTIEITWRSPGGCYDTFAITHY